MTMNAAPSRRSPDLLDFMAVFAILWAVARAHAQALTVDEAESFLFWVARVPPTHWMAASNNHVLNSMLMRLAVSVFGASHLTVRMPALMGAGLYIVSAHSICRRVTRDRALQLVLFVCLVYNPFIFDYLVAARGYSLALGLLLCALALIVRRQMLAAGERPTSLIRFCALCSVCGGLSFAAQFSFALVILATLLGIFVVACCEAWGSAEQRIRRYAEIMGACVVPAASVGVFVSVYTVSHWPAGQLTAGTASVGPMFLGLLVASSHQLNPYVVNPLFLQPLDRLESAAFWLLGAAALCQAVFLSKDRSWLRDPGSRPQAVVFGTLLGIGIVFFCLHLLAFQLGYLNLPTERAAIFFVPFLTLILGLMAALPVSSAAARRCGRVLVVLLAAIAASFLLSMRLTYFRQWRWNAGLDKVYSVLVHYNRAHKVRDVSTIWKYASSLNFYRIASGRETFPEFASALTPQPGHQLYVLDNQFSREFISANQLHVVYLDEFSQITVAISPEVRREEASGDGGPPP